tara:strand:- start:19 stop:219 length:201 start_codon:yes stop_codon:yes gene_type:complete
VAVELINSHRQEQTVFGVAVAVVMIQTLVMATDLMEVAVALKLETAEMAEMVFAGFWSLNNESINF